MADSAQLKEPSYIWEGRIDAAESLQLANFSLDSLWIGFNFSFLFSGKTNKGYQPIRLQQK